jgi:pimeloyl-ACP methyl ester carboxylesterase
MQRSLVHYREYGQQGPALFIMHGIFGMLDNWHYVSGILGTTCKVVSFDARNHGKSFHHPEMTFNAMAEDLIALMDHLGVEKGIVLGHSMGGKTAMHAAMHYPDRLEALIVADIAPKAYKPGHLPYFEAFEHIPLHMLGSRREADDAFRHYAPDPGVRQFLLKNLEPLPDGGYTTKFNLSSLKQAYPEIIGGLDLQGVNSGPSLFVYGMRSGYLKDEDRPKIVEHFPKAHFVGIPDAGHWVHADQPQLFIDEVHNFIQQLQVS